ncbi:ribosome maturation factor RimM [Oleomonas cavernae]|uniref:Ribosome maturation factor RimM n=1 Tax=Oleomonas cavernae TaxID=2320859 RepID=A0A418WER4_9PROT|nr:ribosome maturation factor RimM [Oleomonas cavernae]RJF88484.1 ribosome maturation factor RimM [Oleomonas cavernae]
MVRASTSQQTTGTTAPAVVEGPDYVCIGAIAAAHGIRGEVKVKSFTAEPVDVGAYGPVTTDRGQVLTLKVLREQGKAVIARIDGVGDRNAAEALRGLKLFVARAALPAPVGEDEFYHADLLGLAVEDEAGDKLGRVLSIQDFGAGDMIEVALAAGGSAFLAFTRQAVPVVDVKNGRVIVAPPEGWLDQGEADVPREGQP